MRLISRILSQKVFRHDSLVFGDIPEWQVTERIKQDAESHKDFEIRMHAKRLIAAEEALKDCLYGVPTEWANDDMRIFRSNGTHAIIADNVLDYLKSQPDAEIRYHDLPQVRLPFPTVWIEWSTYRCISAHGSQRIAKQAGVLLWNENSNDIHYSPWATINGEAVLLFENNDVETGESGEFVRISRTTDDGFAYIPHFSELLSEIESVMLMTLGFMHCKNVVRQDASESENPPQKWLRRQHQPRLIYKILQIDPMKRTLRNEGQSEIIGLKRALHICRGHFATYTEDKPLFGRVTGTFWKPAHVRGSSEHGTVIKDYAVNPS